jgi:NAD(P)-dependent dehydrogenase (short-subunit alcohol dehydrogenase family)
MILMKGRLLNKVAVVTGGATGIGEAISKKFILEGAKVIVNGLPDDPVDDVVDEIRKDGGESFAFVGDISESGAAEKCIGKAYEKFGRLDILINNAGTFQTVSPVEDFPIEDFDYMTKMNIRSCFLMSRFAVPYLKKTRGNIISTASEAGTVGQPDCAPYGGSKGWIIAFMRGVALEQAKNGIRANCVCPGPTDTQWHDTEISPMTEKMESDIIKSVPLGRHANPEEIANVFAFLASDEASFVTGALYFADGGISIGRGASGEDKPDTLRKAPEGQLNLKHSHEGLENKKVKTI